MIEVRVSACRCASRTAFAIAVVLLNALSFALLAYLANRKGHHAMAALAAAGAWLFGATGVLIWLLALILAARAALNKGFGIVTCG
jgi:hypothetical protein